jgi:hypothetical protein
MKKQLNFTEKKLDQKELPELFDIQKIKKKHPN